MYNLSSLLKIVTPKTQVGNIQHIHVHKGENNICKTLFKISPLSNLLSEYNCNTI